MNIRPESIFTALSNETRLRCLSLLMSHGELCVCEFTEVVGAAQPNVSRHLAQLREAGLVTDRRDSQWIYYRINPDLPDWVDETLEAVASGTRSTDPYKSDQKTLAAMPNRRKTARCAPESGVNFPESPDSIPRQTQATEETR